MSAAEIERGKDIVLSTTRYRVQYMTEAGPKQHTFFDKVRAREFAKGKKWFGKAARVEEVKR
jgi:hypothetical protein